MMADVGFKIHQTSYIGNQASFIIKLTPHYVCSKKKRKNRIGKIR